MGEPCEMECLNLDAVDLVELEHRLELAATGPVCPGNAGTCTDNTLCSPNCGCNGDGWF